MNKAIAAAAASCALGFLSGCASMKPMALSKDVQQLDLTQESVAVMTVRVANTYKTGYQPRLRYVAVRSDDGEKRSRRSRSASCSRATNPKRTSSKRRR